MAISQLTRSHAPFLSRDDSTSPRTPHFSPPQVLKQATKQTMMKKKVSVSARKLKTVHGGGNRSINENALGGFYSSLGSWP